MRNTRRHPAAGLWLLILLLAQSVAPALHGTIAHRQVPSASRTSAHADPAASVACTDPDAAPSHDPSTCAVCQIIAQGRSGYLAPAVIAVCQPLVSVVVPRGPDALNFPAVPPTSVSPRGPPLIA